METINVLPRVLDGVDTVIHLGAGRCRELPEYLAAACRHIVLVEANPKVARTLQAQSRSHENVQVVQRAVSGQAGDSTLHVYNLAERSSLRKAAGLLDFYPGLRLLERIPVTACSAGSILAELDSEHPGKICLVIDTPGEELSIIEGMARDNVLKGISSLVLRCAQVPMYEGAAFRQDIVDFLDTRGFEILQETGEGGIESALALKLNGWKLENTRLQERLAALDADLTDLRRESTSEAAKLRETISEKNAELQALADDSKKLEHESARQKKTVQQERERVRQLEQERDRSYQRIDSLTVESSQLRDAISNRDVELQAHHKEIDAYERACTEQQELVAQLKEQTQHLQAERNDLQERLSVFESKNGRLEEEFGLEKQRANDLQRQHDTLHEQTQRLTEEIKQKEAALAEARRDLGIAIRLQTLRQNDLEELQQRYGTALDLQTRQHQLLLKLQQRLSVAAEHLKQIGRDGVVSIDDKLAQRLVRALTASVEEN